jgi:hypothetical protein
MLVVGGQYVLFGSLADILTSPRHVRFTPQSRHSSGASCTSAYGTKQT